MRRLAPFLLLAACSHEAYDDPGRQLAGFTVQFQAGAATGTVAEPLPFPSAIPAELTLLVAALDQHGDQFPYSGRARVSVVPGELVSAERVQFTDGIAQVAVRWRFSYGETRIWVEDAGEDPLADCENELDDDGDGLTDQFDPDCQMGAEGAAPPASYATGISPALHFARTRIRDLQFSPRCNTDTPLGGQNVTISTGTLVVTGTTQSGMYVTDLDGPDGGYNSVYLFTFSNPGDVRRGDRLCSIAGNAAEFIGNTQLNFPSFVNADTNRNGQNDAGDIVTCDLPKPDLIGPDAVPEPHLLTVQDLINEERAPTDDFYLVCHPDGGAIEGLQDASSCASAARALTREELRASPIDCARDNFRMEPWEHALVAFEDVTISTRFEKCDFNDDGFIERRGGQEGDCERECSDDPLCTERISLEQFGQFAAGINCASVDPPVCEGKIFISTRDTLGGSGYDPEASAGSHYARVAGHLRQLQPGAGVPSSWILEPRFIEDFVPDMEGMNP